MVICDGQCGEWFHTKCVLTSVRKRNGFVKTVPSANIKYCLQIFKLNLYVLF